MVIMRPNYPLINLLVLIIGNERMADQSAVGAMMPFNHLIRVPVDGLIMGFNNLMR